MSALLTVAETEADLRHRLATTRDAVLRDRLHFLLLAATGAVASITQAADRLLRHRNTVSRWAADYRRGGLDALLDIGTPGKPPGQRTIPHDAFEALKARLASETGFASYIEVEHWLRDQHGVEVCYSTLHQIVRYELGAKLKAPRPSHPKKVTPPQPTS